MKFTSTENTQVLMAEGDYEVMCVKAEEGTTKTYVPVINFDFVVREDVEQAYQRKHIFKSFYQDEQTKEWPMDKIGRYFNALGIPKGQEAELCDLVGLCCMVRIKHYDAKDGTRRECIHFPAPTKAGQAVQAAKPAYSVVDDEELPF